MTDGRGAKRRRAGIREKVLAAFLILSILPLAVFAALTMNQIGEVAELSGKTGKDSLVQQARRNLLRIATDQGNETTAFVDGLVRTVSALQQKADDLWTNRSKYGNGSYPAFRYTNSSQTPLVPGLPAYGYLNATPGEGNGAWGDWQKRLQGAPYLNSTIVKRAMADKNYAASVSADQDTAMRLDLALRSAYDEQNPHAVLSWMVRLGGVSNSYGRPNLDFGYLLWLGTVSKGQQGLTDKFDEDHASYMVAAGPAKNPGRKVVFLNPYYDTVGNGWIVSVVAPVYDSKGFAATVGLDVRLKSLEAAILGLRAYQTGSAFLMAADGLAVAHRDLERKRAEKMAQDPGNVDVFMDELLPATPTYRSALDAMKVAKAPAIADVQDTGGKKQLLAYAPIARLGFALGVVVQEEEVLRPVAQTTEKINADAGTSSLVVLAVTAVAGVIAVAVGVAIANRVVKPVQRLTQLASSLGKGEIDESVLDRADLKVESKDAQRGDEVGELATAFGSMLNTIRDDIKAQQKPTTIIIKDSVINRATIGGGGVGPAAGAPADEDRPAPKKAEGLKFCPFCGSKLAVLRKPKYCPSCRKELPPA